MITNDISVRDPLYGFIGLTDIEVELVDTPVVQRLRRIKQLANAYLVYPAACHTRFEHSLGVLHIATRMAHQLRLSNDELKTVRYASLLHDIGHGPFSHAFESTLSNINGLEKGNHEAITRLIIETNEEIKQILGDETDNVLLLFSDNRETVSNQIISGNIDADKLDYLRRDSYHIGVAYGIFDLERILHTIHRIDDNERSYITILEKGKDALESYRLARFLMHSQVYFHHARVSSDNMLKRAIEIAFRDGIFEKEMFEVQSDGFLENYLSLDDFRLVTRLLQDRDSNAYKLVHDLENRHLLKRGYDQVVTDLDNSLLKMKIIRMKKNGNYSAHPIPQP